VNTGQSTGDCIHRVHRESKGEMEVSKISSLNYIAVNIICIPYYMKNSREIYEEQHRRK
jgi:hypothetical protein